jgi:hypothetical protein
MNLVEGLQLLYNDCAGGDKQQSGVDTEVGVTDDIASRKKEAKQWIENWRRETGGK